MEAGGPCQAGAEAGWQSLAHLSSRIRFFRDEAGALAAAKAFGSLGIPRREALWWAEKLPAMPLLDDPEHPFIWPQESGWTALRTDFASFYTTLGPHPTLIIRTEHWHYALSPEHLTPAGRLRSSLDGSTVSVFGMVISRQAPPTANWVMFATLEDAEGMMNLVFMPDIYEKFHQIIDGQAFLCVRGIMQLNGESHSILVKQVFTYERRPAVLKQPPQRGNAVRPAYRLQTAPAAGSARTWSLPSRDYR